MSDVIKKLKLQRNRNCSEGKKNVNNRVRKSQIVPATEMQYEAVLCHLQKTKVNRPCD